ncbi:MAG: hypothetical protein RL632_1103 [Bacteroidota bacterium]|jgi:hypothetical protein
MSTVISEDRIFSLNSIDDFNRLALDIYAFQKTHCAVYKNFIDLLGRPEPKTYTEIPFLPISFFKEQEIIAEGFTPQLTFLSSGTTGMNRSQHLVARSALYERSFMETYRKQIGQPEDQVILALLPSYLEQGHSSLVYMVDRLIAESKSEHSGFLLHSIDDVEIRYEQARRQGKKTILFGVSYALLDLAEKGIDLSDATIIETGGMKGRRKEMTKVALHDTLKNQLKAKVVLSEYGMTELLSQAYCDDQLNFRTPPWMKVLVRDINDPLSWGKPGKTGGINVIDLANLYSCSFIATQDLGRVDQDSFQILGRYDQSDVRGCNLLVE